MPAPIFVNMIRTKHFILLIIPFFLTIWLFVNTVFSTDSYTEKRWTFEFVSCPFEDVLRQLSFETDIEISTNIDMKGFSVNRSYRNSTLDHIISDIFRGSNHAIIWRYEKSKLNAVEIWTRNNGTIGKDIVKYIPTRHSSETERKKVPNGEVQREKGYTEGKSLKEIPLKWQYLEPPPVPSVLSDR